jgi:hypothetical protein
MIIFVYNSKSNQILCMFGVQGLRILGLTIKTSLHELGMFFFFLLIAMVIFSSAVYYAEVSMEQF